MKFIKSLIIKPYAYCWLSALFLLLGILLSQTVIFKPKPYVKALNFEKQLNKRYSLLKSFTIDFTGKSFPKNEFNRKNADSNLSEWDRNSMLFLVYRDDSLIYWSDNAASFPSYADKDAENNIIKKLPDGWYLWHSVDLPQNYSVTGLALVKHSYPYENDYLKNTFYQKFSASPGDDISLAPPGIPIKDNKGLTLLYYKASEGNPLPQSLVLPVFLSMILSFLFFFFFIYKLFGKLKFYSEKPALFFAAFAADVLLLRILGFWFHCPSLLYNTWLFSPSYFAASFWLPSLGDLLTNIIILFFLSLLFFKMAWKSTTRPKKISIRIFVSAICAAAILFFFAAYVLAIKIIVANSSFAITFSHLSSDTMQAILVFVIIAMLSGCLFLLSLPLLKILFRNINSPWRLPAFIFSTAALALLLHWLSLPPWIPLLVFSVGIFWIYYTLLGKNKLFSLSSVLFLIILCSFLSTYLLIIFNDTKEIEQRKLIAQKLASERDPLAEYLIKETYVNMQQDTVLLSLLKHYPEHEINEQEAIQYITDRYFSNYWQKFNLEFTLCTPDRILNVVIPDNTLINCKDYFSQLIKMVGKPTLSGNLYYLDYGAGNLNYIAKLPFQVNMGTKTSEVNLYIDITSKRIPKGIGYPELLISKESRINLDIYIYSYAIYRNDELLRSFGKYPYPLNAENFINTSQKFLSFSLNTFNHLSYNFEKDKLVIVSLKNNSFLDNITPFSYLAIFISIITLFSVLVLSPPGKLQIRNLTFRNRLQGAMILLILFSFVIIGITSGYYIVRLNYSKNVDALTEKAHSILTEVQQKFGKVEKLGPEMSNEMFSMLNQFSLIYFSDINIFDLQGDLLASSRPQIFEEGLISTKMNPHSFNELSINQRSLYIHEDNIGNYSFLSAYLPFRNQQDKIIGYINLPYFARQDEIRTELSSFLVAFVNIYVLLVAFSILIAVAISRYLTKPLILLKDKISQVKLGKPNEKINWKIEDEIGGLVEEYNAMIDKLAFSAEQLARSERESAWREMARQVAHEIKNPLTPMKLSVQLLIKAYNEKDADWEQRLMRFSQTLIEQIENLSQIAGSFSDFARMPESKKEKISLSEVINSAVELYRDNDELKISTEFPPELIPTIRGDRNQIMRIMVNLFKNSIQSFKPGMTGEIRIILNENNGFYELVFSDNGSGIEKNQQAKIFSPNFTTKTGGMGLGLAMVKSIVEDHGGTISFSSEAGEGTQFFLRFPAL